MKHTCDYCRYIDPTRCYAHARRAPGAVTLVITAAFRVALAALAFGLSSLGFLDLLSCYGAIPFRNLSWWDVYRAGQGIGLIVAALWLVRLGKAATHSLGCTT